MKNKELIIKLGDNLIKELSGVECVANLESVEEHTTLFGQRELYSRKITFFETYEIKSGSSHFIKFKSLGGFKKHEIKLTRKDVDNYITELGLFSVEDSYDIKESNYDDYLTLFDMTFMIPKDNLMRAIYIAHLKTLVEINSLGETI